MWSCEIITGRDFVKCKSIILVIVISDKFKKLQRISTGIPLESHVQGTVLGDGEYCINIKFWSASNHVAEFQMEKQGYI